MIQTVNDLRNALMFDVETDSDIAACEAACEITDFALESTLCDYRNGSASIATLEAADAASGEADKKWYIKLKNGIVNFVKAAAQTIRSLLTRLQNFIARQKALSAAKKLEKRDANSKYASINVDSGLYNALKTGMERDFDAEIVKTVKDAKEGGNNSINIKAEDFFDPAKGDSTVAVGPDEAKGFLNGVAVALQKLNKSFSKTDAIMKQLENEPDPTKKSLVRRAITVTYNAMSAATRKYFHAASAIANDLCKKDKTIDKEIDKANKDQEKFSKKSVEYAGDREKMSDAQYKKATKKSNAMHDKAMAAKKVANKYNLAPKKETESK